NAVTYKARVRLQSADVWNALIERGVLVVADDIGTLQLRHILCAPVRDMGEEDDTVARSGIDGHLLQAVRPGIENLLGNGPAPTMDDLCRWWNTMSVFDIGEAGDPRPVVLEVEGRIDTGRPCCIGSLVLLLPVPVEVEMPLLFIRAGIDMPAQ